MIGRPFRLRALTALELVFTVAIIVLAVGLGRLAFVRVVEQRARAATRAYLAAIDAAKLEWQSRHPDVDPATEPPEADIVPLLSLGGRAPLARLADLAPLTGGRAFFINALRQPATCSPPLDGEGPSAGGTPVPTAAPTPTPLPAATATPRPSATLAPSPTPVASNTPTPTPEPTATVWPSPTASPTPPGPTLTPQPTSAPLPSPTPLPTATQAPTAAPTTTPPPTATPPPLPSPTRLPATPTPEPSFPPTPTPSRPSGTFEP
ncbi:MAG: hypothetical protein JSR82_09480 [Verrucomicrobia bacterium]|nr:hypothetical protein [Verrucomicrobiota bacterium]